jgi:hypothetical protein
MPEQRRAGLIVVAARPQARNQRFPAPLGVENSTGRHEGMARIYENLIADHDRHRSLLEKIAAADAGSTERQGAFDQLRIELQAHAAAEEESLYAIMLADPDLRDSARHSVAEHKEIDDKLGELVDLDGSSDDWTKAFEELRHRYLHHIDEEEEEMFPEAEQGLSAADERKAADTFEERKPEELEIAKAEQPGDDRD